MTGSPAHRRDRRRSRRHRSGDRAQGSRRRGALVALRDRPLRAVARNARSRRFARGRVSAEAGRAAYDAIVAATADALAGRIDAIATAPVNKEAFAAAGLPVAGTHRPARAPDWAPRVAMMFYAESLRVVLATVHIPLAEVPRALTREVVEGTIELAGARAAAFRHRVAAPRRSPV